MPKSGDGPRRPISMALFESVSYLIIELITLPKEKQNSIKNKFEKLLLDDEFIESTTYIVDSNKSVKKRFELVEEIIREIRNA